MIFRFLADLILILHFCFVLFAVFGGALILLRRSVLYLHLPAVLWGILVEVFQMPCPLTTLENLLRRLGGETEYAGGFIEHYVSMILYPTITPQFQIFLGILLAATNLLVYSTVIRRNRRIDLT